MARRRPWFALLAVLLALVAGAASAQEPARQGATAAVVPLDRVIVVVNDEALTQWDLNEERRVFLEQLKASNITPPPNDVLDKQVLQRLIIERALLLSTKRSGIRVDDTTVERTILRVAQENKLSPEEFRKVLEKEHIPYGSFSSPERGRAARQPVTQRRRP